MDLTPEQVESRMSMLDSDPPGHTRLRTSSTRRSRPGRSTRTRGGSARSFDEVLDAELVTGELDFVDAVAIELPMRILCELMGVPLEDRRYLVELGNRMLGNTDPDHGRASSSPTRPICRAYAHLPFSSPAAPEMFAYANRLAAERRRHPARRPDDEAARGRRDGDHLSEHEFDLFFLLLVTAGNETTRHAMSNGLLTLLEHPEERDRLLADPELVPTAVEEILRWTPSLLHFRRTATRDVELRGDADPSGRQGGALVRVRKPGRASVPDASRFDVGREPNRHLAFGLGSPHYCLGAHLARLELRVWLEEMLPIVGRIELAGSPRRLRSNFFHGVKSLPIRVR